MCMVKEPCSTNKGKLFMITSITEKELSREFDLSLSKIRQDRQRKKGFPYVKIGKSVRYPLDRVYEYLHDKVVSSTTK